MKASLSGQRHRQLRAQRFVSWLRRRFCSHRYYIEDLKRVSPKCVTVCCYKCGKQV